MEKCLIKIIQVKSKVMMNQTIITKKMIIMLMKKIKKIRINKMKKMKTKNNKIKKI